MNKIASSVGTILSSVSLITKEEEQEYKKSKNNDFLMHRIYITDERGDVCHYRACHYDDFLNSSFTSFQSSPILSDLINVKAQCG